ncbi:hypothetical protein TVAG_256760 [Trichomonas vaginalis G3]|uniref:Uncharacterized protein n=1 Tax=Trichomonas vaginalis (strain ATCC PRA-98 / G3) TaxID=412133 RepID=A2FEY2_TRIV3|nr:hypothetical protein TVAGG3_0046900 [Trichomonas vaginalis G3]EAX96536.1 hypothetical protein TVAG_256760 [Trichomonas vaginalis G3]KAI5541096.1 hypothetical protein TVAGG3_0046900 [Trichomonas vaginalis G3]|eukprot:XP_001309466.1 hypothetical protein [Trichomonas vaginalis G3]
MEDSFSGLDTPIKSQQIGKTQIPPPVSGQFSSLLSSASIMNHNLENLESRVNTCNSVYKLATDTNEIRQKEQTQHINNIQEFLNNLESRLAHIETYLKELPERVHTEAAKQIQAKSNFEDMKMLVEMMDRELSDRFDNLENIIEENDKIMTKTYKKLKNEMDQIGSIQKNEIEVGEIQNQLNMIEQKNKQMRSMVETLKDSVTDISNTNSVKTTNGSKIYN